MRNRFEQQLQLLYNDLLAMGASAEQAINCAIHALTDRDETAAKQAIDLERELDSQERTVEALCLKLLLEQQPVASDLRLVSAALKMITDLERIGDQAADIAEIILQLLPQPYIKPLTHLEEMARHSAAMVTDSLDAFVQKDIEKARKVFQMDDIVDKLFVTIKGELINLIHANADNGCQAMDLLMIAKYFERIGDHAQNISEWVDYALTGVHKGRQGQ